MCRRAWHVGSATAPLRVLRSLREASGGAPAPDACGLPSFAGALTGSGDAGETVVAEGMARLLGSMRTMRGAEDMEVKASRASPRNMRTDASTCMFLAAPRAAPSRQRMPAVRMPRTCPRDARVCWQGRISFSADSPWQAYLDLPSLFTTLVKFSFSLGPSSFPSFLSYSTRAAYALTRVAAPPSDAPHAPPCAVPLRDGRARSLAGHSTAMCTLRRHRLS